MISGLPRTSVRGLDIEVLDVRPSGNGVEAFVKAWRKGAAVGFGDGTVEVERFRLFNPPSLIPHPDGQIRRIRQGFAGQSLHCFVAHPELALLESIRQSLGVVRKFDSQHIIKGKVGNTVSTFRSAAGSSDPVDGSVSRGGVSQSFASICTGNGTDADAAATPTAAGALIAVGGVTPDLYSALYRSILLFDTSAISSGDSISDVTLTLTGSSKNNQLGDCGLVVVASAPAANNALASGDFQTMSKTAFCTAMAYGSLPVAEATVDRSLNASGIAAVAKGSGRTKYGLMLDWDQLASFGGTWLSGGFSYWDIHFADESGTTQDPLLTVTHSATGGDSFHYDQMMRQA